MDVWIARDDDGCLYLYWDHPEKPRDTWYPIVGGGFRPLDRTLFLQVKPGESLAARVTIGAKADTLF